MPVGFEIWGAMMHTWFACCTSSYSWVPFVGDSPFVLRATVFMAIATFGYLQHGWSACAALTEPTAAH